MTRDDIIHMAREAGYGEALSDLHAPALERFAALVAAAEREECAHDCFDTVRDAVRVAVEAEREACAQAVLGAGFKSTGVPAYEHIADRIRARSNK